MTTADLVSHTEIQSPPASALAPPAPGTADNEPLRIRARVQRRWLKRLLKRAAAASLLVGFVLVSGHFGYTAVPMVLAVYLACGVLDVLRNTRRNLFTFDQYFFGNGIGTWLLSPFNLLMDLLALPYRNRGIYRMQDLTDPIREEINDLIHAAHDSNVIEQLRHRIGDGRSMIFFKWYGRNISNSIHIPAFHKQYRFIRTVGVSVFNRRRSTSWHFGPLRATFRVLYNLCPSADDAAFIQIGRYTHRWNQCPLLIFDDTLMHRSCNETDAVRYCMFVDVIRPTLCPPVFRAIVSGLQRVLLPIRFRFYRRWSRIQ